MFITFWLLTVAVFTIIQLPPGDFLTSYIAALEDSGTDVDQAQVEALRRYYGLDAGYVEQYFRWISNFIRGDMGRSLEWGVPVIQLLRERVPLTVLVTVSTMLFTYAVAIPVAIYSATHQYTPLDYVTSVFGFIGLATPNFLLGLLLLFLFFKYFGISVGGLFSPEYRDASWSLAKSWDLFQHLWAPLIVIGSAGTAGTIRVLRGTLLDELSKPYVVTARAKGVAESKLLFKYPVRIALNPIASSIGWQLPRIISGSTIVSIVLDLPTTGPILFRSLMSQDMFMAGSIVMVLGILTIIGTLISDVLLVALDPRIRFEGKA
jgi:peptide/nickel transport system permease protein